MNYSVSYFLQINYRTMYNKQKAQNIKQGAFFDYFKCFAFSAVETIRKLERTFHEQFSEELGLDSNGMLKRVKALLSGYEILILQINDSCQFVEIPEFGGCLLKIFYQLMSVIKYLASNLISKSAQEKSQRKVVQRYTTTYPVVDLKVDAAKQERQAFRSREKAAHIFKELTQEIKNIEKQTKHVFQQNEESLQKIIKRRQKLQQIESSQSEAILAETVSMLFKRGEHINNFLNLLQSGQNQYPIKENEAYNKLKQLIEEDNYGKICQAKEKLNHLFKEQMTELQKKRKGAMQSVQTQAKLQSDDQTQNSQLRKSQNRKTNFDQTKKLKMEIRLLEEQNSTLKDYLKEKIEDYEGIATRLRAEKISLQNKLSNLQNYALKSKGSIEYFKKSQSNLDQQQNIENMSQINSHLSFDEEHQRQLQESGEKQAFVKKSKVNIGKQIKTKVKFIDTKSNLQILSKIVELSIPCQNSVMEEPTRVQPPNTGKPEQKLDAGSLHNIQKNQVQEMMLEKRKKSIKWCKSIEKRRSSLQQSKILISSVGICNRVWKQETLHNEQRQKIENPLKFKSEEPFFIQSKQTLLNAKECSKQANKPKTAAKQTQPGEQPRRRESVCQALKIAATYEIEEKQEDQKENVQNTPLLSSSHIKNCMPSRFKSPKFAEISSPSPNQNKSCGRLDKAQQEDRGEERGKVGVRPWSLEVRPGQLELKLCSDDLLQIFISEQNAKNYQILNLSLSIKQKRFFSAPGTRNLTNQLKSKAQQTQEPQLPRPLTQTIKYLSGVVSKALAAARRDKKTYKKLCNFIRYPHSSIYLAQTPEWNSQEDEVSIDYAQLRKLLGRILKLHCECNQAVCQHLKYFLRKIGAEQK